MQQNSHMILSGVWYRDYPLGKAGGDLLCFRCGTRIPSPIPCNIDVILDRLSEFEEAHSACRQDANGELLRELHDKALDIVKRLNAPVGRCEG